MNDSQYAMWRFMYWITKGNMTYEDIDHAVARGDLAPGAMPESAEASSSDDYGCAGESEGEQ